MTKSNEELTQKSNALVTMAGKIYHKKYPIAPIGGYSSTV